MMTLKTPKICRTLSMITSHALGSYSCTHRERSLRRRPSTSLCASQPIGCLACRRSAIKSNGAPFSVLSTGSALEIYDEYHRRALHSQHNKVWILYTRATTG